MGLNEEFFAGIAQHQLSPTGFIGRANTDEETRKKTKLELKLMSRKIQLEAEAREQAASSQFARAEQSRVNQFDREQAAKVVPPDQFGTAMDFLTGKPDVDMQSVTHPTPQGWMAAGARPLLGKSASSRPQSSLDEVMNDPTHPLVKLTAEAMRITPEELAAKNPTFRQIDAMGQQRGRMDVNARFNTNIVEKHKSALALIEKDHASTEEVFNVMRDALGVLAKSDRILALKKGIRVSMNSVLQNASSDSPEDAALRNAASIFGRQRDAFALSITKGLSGVQMREDEKEDVKRALPDQYDTIEYASTFLDNFERVIGAAKEARIIALSIPFQENPAVKRVMQAHLESQEADMKAGVANIKAAKARSKAVNGDKPLSFEEKLLQLRKGTGKPLMKSEKTIKLYNSSTDKEKEVTESEAQKLLSEPNSPWQAPAN